MVQLLNYSSKKPCYFFQIAVIINKNREHCIALVLKITLAFCRVSLKFQRQCGGRLKAVQRAFEDSTEGV